MDSMYGYLPAYASTNLYCLVTEAHVCEQRIHSSMQTFGDQGWNPWSYGQ